MKLLLCPKESRRAKRGTSQLDPKGRRAQPTATLPVLLERMRQKTSPCAAATESPECPLPSEGMLVLGRGLDAALALAAPALQCGQSPAFRKASQKKKREKKSLFAGRLHTHHSHLSHSASVSSAMHNAGKTHCSTGWV